MAWTYYIDGYNVIHHSAKLKRLAEQDFEAAREHLMAQVAQFCAATGSCAKLAFDGRGPTVATALSPVPAPTLEVLYSMAGQSADGLLERLVYAARNRSEIVVVSGDHGLRELCRGLGALVMEPKKFLATLAESRATVRGRLERIQGAQPRASVEDRLDDSGRERLRQLRRRLGP